MKFLIPPEWYNKSGTLISLFDTDSDEDGVVIGNGASGSGSYNISIGANSKVTGDYSINIGGVGDNVVDESFFIQMGMQDQPYVLKIGDGHLKLPSLGTFASDDTNETGKALQFENTNGIGTKTFGAGYIKVWNIDNPDGKAYCSLVPSLNGKQNLGHKSWRFNEIYGNTIDISGTVTASQGKLDAIGIKAQGIDLPDSVTIKGLYAVNISYQNVLYPVMLPFLGMATKIIFASSPDSSFPDIAPTLLCDANGSLSITNANNAFILSAYRLMTFN